jgi:hypothetical protein
VGRTFTTRIIRVLILQRSVNLLSCFSLPQKVCQNRHYLFFWLSQTKHTSLVRNSAMVKDSNNNRRNDRRGNDSASTDVAIAIAATVGLAIGAGVTWLWNRMSSAEAVPATNSHQPSNVPHSQNPSATKPRFDASKVERAGENDTLCAVCMENKPNCAFQPCQHMVVCSGCAALCKDCPMCRAAIRNRLTLFV